MELQNVFTRKQALFLVGTIILLSFRASEEADIDCNSSNLNFFRSLNDECCPNYEHCLEIGKCGGEFAGRYCNITDPTVVCPVTDLPWLKCRDKKRCYPRQLRCDGIRNCRDGSDEERCGAEPMRAEGVFLAMKFLTSVIKLGFDPPTIISEVRITKFALALSSTDRRLLKPNTKTRDEIAHELSLRLLTKLTLEENISTYELSEYINALIVTCINPRDFFGFNLVAELRKRVNRSKMPNPFTILTLCNARDTMTREDVSKLQIVFHANSRPLWTETQSLATMALACISSHSRLQIEEEIISDMVKELKRKQQENGTYESVRTTAIVFQALLAADSYQREFDVQQAIKLLVDKAQSEDFNLRDIYRILPVLNHMSLVDVSSGHCSRYNEAELGKMEFFEDVPKENVLVKFSLYTGENKHFVKTWKLKVPVTSNLYQILEIVSFLEPEYRVKYTVSNRKPYVTRIGNFTEDAEAGEFWFIYKQPFSSRGRLIKDSPVDVPVKATEELILWFKTAAWYHFYEDDDSWMNF